MQFSLKRTAMRVVCALLTFALILSIPLTAPMTAQAESYKPYNTTQYYTVGDRTYYDVYGTDYRDLSTPSNLFRRALEQPFSYNLFDAVKTFPLYQWWRYVGQAAFTGDDNVHLFGSSGSGMDALAVLDTRFGTSNRYGWNKYNNLHESASLVQALSDIGSTAVEQSIVNPTDSMKQVYRQALEQTKLLTDSEIQPTFYTVDSIVAGGGSFLSLFATVFYDLKLSYIETGKEHPSAVTGAKTVAEAIGRAGFTYSEGDPETTYMTGVSNYTPVDTSAQQSLSNTQTVGIENRVSDMKGFQWGLEEKVSLQTEFEAKIPFIGSSKVTAGVEITGSQLWSTEHTTENAATEEKSGSMESTLSVTLPPHTAAVLKQSSSNIGMTLKYDYPVAISFKVKHIYFTGISGVASGYGMYSFGSADAGFTNAADDLDDRFVRRNVSGYEKARGGTSIDWNAAFDNLSKTALCTTNGYGLTFNPGALGWQRLSLLIGGLYLYRPMSAAGGELRIAAKGVSSEVYGVSPIYPLRTVKQAGGAVDYDMSSGDKFYVDNIALEGYNTEGVPYFGFNAERGSWKLVDESGAELTGTDVPAKLVTNPATGYTSLVANDKDGTIYLKYFIDEKAYIYNTNFDTPTKNSDLKKTAVVQVNVSKLPFKGDITVSGELSGIVGDPKVNLFDPDESGLDVFIEDESGKELTRPVIWEAKQVESRGVKVDSNFIEFTKPGEFQIRAVSGDVKSDWFTVTALPARKLYKIEIADTVSPAALNIDAATLPRTINLSALAVNGFDQYGSPSAISSPTPFEAEGAAVYPDPATGDSLIDITTVGAISVFVKDGGVESNRLAVKLRKLDKIKIADTASPAALRIDAATLPQTLNLSALAASGALAVDGFDQDGNAYAVTTPAPFVAEGAAVYPDPVTGDSLIDITTVGAISVFVKDWGVASNRLDVTFTNLPKPPEPDPPVVQAVPGTSNLTYDANGGEIQGAITRTVTEKSAYGAHSTATRKGYTFAGWYTDKDGGSEVTDAAVVTQTQDHTLYAHWTANQYNVKFNVNKGKAIKTKSKAVTFDAKVGKLPAVKRTGYVFKGWYSKKSGGVEITANTVYETAADKTVYAQWRKPVLMGKLNKTTNAVHIRKSAAKKSAVLGYYEKGDTFRIYGKVDRKGTLHDWYMIKYNGKAGFVWAPVVTTYRG